jgi:oligopeptide/dipeptide ABC transporter ATP-binding protein
VVAETETMLRVEMLTKSFAVGARAPRVTPWRPRPKLTALDGVSFDVASRQIVGIVGESGSGKSTLAKCLVRLVEPDAGTILYRGRDVGQAGGRQLMEVRRELQLIYQDPYSSLNPLMNVEEAVAEPAWVHGLVERGERHLYADGLLELVGLSTELARRRPSELSGGQRQRVAIARAMAVRPQMLIADEAVSALDVSAQAQILNLLGALREDRGVGILLISHQLSVVAQIADIVLIMYLGRIVESGPASRVFSAPAHPYTAGLLAAQPGRHRLRRRRVPALKGEIPSPLEIPSGCRFRTRCPRAESICEVVDPPRVETGPGHAGWCHFAV